MDQTNEAKWYVVHTYSGYENKVKTNLEKIIENRGISHLITDVKIPSEIVVEQSGDKTKEVESKLFPSYVFVKMIMSDETWHVVRNIRRYRICRSRFAARPAFGQRSGGTRRRYARGGTRLCRRKQCKDRKRSHVRIYRKSGKRFGGRQKSYGYRFRFRQRYRSRA